MIDGSVEVVTTIDDLSVEMIDAQTILSIVPGVTISESAHQPNSAITVGRGNNVFWRFGAHVRINVPALAPAATVYAIRFKGKFSLDNTTQPGLMHFVHAGNPDDHWDRWLSPGVSLLISTLGYARLGGLKRSLENILRAVMNRMNDGWGQGFNTSTNMLDISSVLELQFSQNRNSFQ